MHRKGLLTYALNSIGNLVYIDEVDTGQLCNCYCLSCKEKLVAKNGGMKRVHHFAHASGVDCENAYETMLHQLAKLRVQEAFLSKEVFNVGFEYRSYCPHVKTCAFVRNGNCYISTHKRFNLKEFYDSCEQEIQYDSINRRSDLKIFSSKKPQLAPIYILNSLLLMQVMYLNCIMVVKLLKLRLNLKMTFKELSMMVSLNPLNVIAGS